MTVGPRRLAGTVLVLGALVVGWATVRIWTVGARDERPGADAIVVLGAAHDGSQPSAVFRARLDHAIELYRQGVAPLLVVTGGGADPSISEAAAGRAYALAAGVPAPAILAEEASSNTATSVANVAALLHDRGLERVVFVSDRSHLFRVLRIARDRGITGHGSPTTSSPNDATLGGVIGSTLHELAGLGAYFLTGR
jgi:uncharacterized SAM-binding protein YcdF (DUF218 family)